MKWLYSFLLVLFLFGTEARAQKCDLDQILIDLQDAKLSKAFIEKPELVDAWKAVSKHADLRTNTKFLENVSRFSDNPNLIQQLDDDLLNTKYQLTDLFKESPDDVTNVWKKLKENPYWARDFAKETADVRWLKWKDREFFKTVTKAGKDFEIVVSGQLQTESSLLRTKLSSMYNINLSQYELFEQVQIKTGQIVNGADEFFVADFVLVERKTVLGQEFLDLDNVIVLETKLSSTTALTTPQTNALAKVKTTSNTFNVRSVSQPGVFNPTNYSLGNSNQLKIKDYIKVYSDGVGTTVQDIISLK